MKNIAIIGGGTGTFTLLAGLRKFPSNNTVIVSSADDGGSTGVLRRELGVMPVGDIRQCLVGLSYTDARMRRIFSYRFEKGSLAGHTAGNILLAAAEKTTGSIAEAIALAGKMLNVRGAIIPVTLFPTRLTATYSDGRKVAGEHKIDEPKNPSRASITGLALSPSGPANPQALAALRRADAIIFGPGDLFTSVLPNLLASGVREAVAHSRAKKILITNIMTKPGQTNGFRASDFVRTLNDYLAIGGTAHPIDTAVVNSKKPAASLLIPYRKQKAAYVEPDTAAITALGVDAAAGDFLARRVFARPRGDRLARSALRHDSDKTARIIWKLLETHNP
ncbi:MAG: gluconeogenesis factor YvcK family protein [Patescibacteria group bacterium]